MFKNKCIAPSCDLYDPVNGCGYWLIGFFYCPYLKNKREENEKK